MLKREDELRLSAEVQKQFANPNFDTIHVAAQVQEQVAMEFGFEDIQEAVSMIRCAPKLYPDNPELVKIPHYLKFNRSKQGNLKVNDIVPNSNLTFLDGSQITLYDYMDTYLNNNKPIIITAGSYT